MTANIKESLNRLYVSMERLEKTAQERKPTSTPAPTIVKSGRKSPPDLFSVPNTATDDVDAKALASRLDGAIAKVEKLLTEEA